MSRNVLPDTQISASALKFLSSFHSEVVQDVKKAIEQDAIVVVGMAHNPFVRRARRALAQAGLSSRYLEYGNYFTQWKQRLAIKLWSGWPTFPQIFVQGRLIGGCVDLERALASGELKNSLAQPRVRG